VAGFEDGRKGPQATEHRWPLDGKDKEREPPFEPPKEKLDLSPVKLTLDFWSPEL